MSVILALDTSTAACSAAVYDGNELVEVCEIAPRAHGERLLPQVKTVLADSGYRLSQCDAIALGQGPGSFMGVRIGAGLAQSLAYAADLPIVAVSSLQALAYAARPHTDPGTIVLAGWDARMGQIYWGCYDNDAACAVRAADQLTDPADVALPTQGACVLIGNAWSVYAETLPFEHDALPYLIDQYPTAGAVAHLAAPQVAAGAGVSADQFSIPYLRPSVVLPR
jgi:tRNA threonylcarbamoyladenosine biosynthesis protein TsaB